MQACIQVAGLIWVQGRNCKNQAPAILSGAVNASTMLFNFTKILYLQFFLYYTKYLSTGNKIHLRNVDISNAQGNSFTVVVCETVSLNFRYDNFTL